MITFRVWFVSNYAHVFVLLSVVIATLPTLTDWRVSDEAVSGRQNPVAIDYDSTADEAERVEQSNVPRRRHRRRRRLRVNTASSVMWLTHKAHSRYATWTKISRLVALILFFAFYLLFVVCMCIRVQRRRAIEGFEALEARAPPQTVWRLWLIVYRTEFKVSLCA